MRVGVYRFEDIDIAKRPSISSGERHLASTSGGFYEVYSDSSYYKLLNRYDIPLGSASGNMLYFNYPTNQFLHTERSELNWNDATKRLELAGNPINNLDAVPKQFVQPIYDLFTNIKDPTGWVSNEAIDVSYDSTTRKITLTGDLRYYWKGVLYELTSPWVSDAHPDIDDEYFLYSADGTTFAWSTSVWNFTQLMVAYAHYHTADSHIFGLREVHGIIPHDSHESNHWNIGTYRTINDGGLATAGTYTLDSDTDADITPGFNLGYVHDEDIKSSITALAEGSYTVMYIDGENSSVFSLSQSVPFLSSGSYIQINDASAGTLSTGAQGKYYNVYDIMMPVTSDSQSQAYRHVFLVPQKEFATLENALEENIQNLDLGEIEHLVPEFIISARLTYQTGASYGSTGKVELRDISYIYGNTASRTTVGGVSSNNHANLSNLQWTASGHYGTAYNVPRFDGLGAAADSMLYAGDNYVYINQVADSQGLQINGWDDKSNQNLKLQINSVGTAEILSTSYMQLRTTAQYLWLRSAENVYYDTGSAAFDHIWREGGTEIARLTGDGKLGIGTVSPNAPLTIGQDVVGMKLSLTDSYNYGIGYRGGLMEIIVHNSSADFTFGHGTSGSLTRLVTIKGTGNVGIGTTSPSYKLHVNGETYSTTFRIPNGGAYRIGDSTTYIGGDGTSDYMTFFTNTNERMRIDSSGNVGIGTTSPDEKLHVSEGNLLLENNRILLWETATGTRQIGIKADTENGINFATADTWDRMYISSTGNVGIGTTSPQQLLEINEDNGTALFLRLDHGNIWDIGMDAGSSFLDFKFNSSDILTLKSNGQITIWSAPNDASASASILRRETTGEIVESDISELIGDIGYWDRSGTTLTPANSGDDLQLSNTSTTGISAPIKAYYEAGASGSQIRSNLTFGAIDNNTGGSFSQGYILSYALEHDGVGYITPTNFRGWKWGYFDGSSYTTAAVITSSGNVGIGTDSPGAGLHVYGTNSTTSKIIIGRTTDTSGPSLEFQENGVKTWAIKQDADAGDISSLQFQNASNEELVTILQGGNFLINTTTAGGYGEKLVVGGEAIIQGLNNRVGVNNPDEGMRSSVNGTLDLTARNNLILYADINGGGSNYIDFHIGDDVGAGTAAMRLTADKNLGLGTTNPTQSISSTETTLQIKNSNVASLALEALNKYVIFSSASGRLSFYNVNDTRTDMTLHSSGNFSIGNTNDTYKLQVTATTQGALYAHSNYGDLYVGDPAVGSRLKYSGQYFLANSAQAKVYTNSLERLRVTGSGLVQIFNFAAGTASDDNVVVVQSDSTLATRTIQDLIGDAGYWDRVVSTDNYLTPSTTGDRVYLGSGILSMTADHLAAPELNTGTGTYISLNYTSSSNNAYGLGIGEARNSKYDIWFQTGSVNGGGYRWYIGTSEKMTMDYLGNVGIGTTYPISKLDIYKSTAEPSLISDNGAFTISDTYVGVQMGSSSTSPYGFWIQGKDRRNNGATYPILLNPLGGNVGIGTASPAYKLDVNGIGMFRSTLFVIPGISVTNSSAPLQMQRGTYDKQMIYMEGTNYGLYNITQTRYDLRISYSTGYITIPNFAPGTSSDDDVVVSQGGVLATRPISELVSQEFDSTYLRLDTANDPLTGELHIQRNASNSQLLLERTGTATGKYAIYTNTNNLYINNVASGTYPVTILNSGYLGIGTVSPNELLTIGTESDTSASSRKAVRIGSGGYSQPGAFNTNSNGDKVILYDSLSANYDGRIGIGSIGNLWFKSMTPTSGGRIDFYLDSNTIPSVRIQPTGNVSIGNTNNTYKLDVSGNVSALDGSSYGYWLNGTQALRRESTAVKVGVPAVGSFMTAYTTDYLTLSTSNTERLTINSTGNVGIGTVSPVEKLHIVSSDTESVAIKVDGGNQYDASLILQESDSFGIRLYYDGDSSVFGKLAVTDTGVETIVQSWDRYGNIYITDIAIDTNGSDNVLVWGADNSIKYRTVTDIIGSELDDVYVNVTGDTMTGDLILNDNDFKAAGGYQIKLLPRGDGATDHCRWYKIATVSQASYANLVFRLINAHGQSPDEDNSEIRFSFSSWLTTPTVSHTITRGSGTSDVPIISVTDEGDGYYRIYARVYRYGDATIIVENFNDIAGNSFYIDGSEFAQGATNTTIETYKIYDTLTNAPILGIYNSKFGINTGAPDSSYGLTIAGSDEGKILLSGATNPYIRFQEGSTNKAYIQWNANNGWFEFYNSEASAVLRLYDAFTFSPDATNYYTIWHAGNDGAGSGLDADLLDGQHGSYYSPTTHTHTYIVPTSKTTNDDPPSYYSTGISMPSRQLITGVGNWVSGINVDSGVGGFGSWQLLAVTTDYDFYDDLYFRHGGAESDSWSSLRRLWHDNNSNLFSVDWKVDDLYIGATDTPLRRIGAGYLALGETNVYNGLRVYYSDGNFAELTGLGVRFNRAGSYLIPNATDVYTLYIGASAQGTNDWAAVKVYTDGTNDFYWNDAVIATQTYVSSGYVPYTGAITDLNIGNNNIMIDSDVYTTKGFIMKSTWYGQMVKFWQEGQVFKFATYHGGDYTTATNSQIISFSSLGTRVDINNANLYLSNNVYATGNVQGAVLNSTVGTGTAPLTVASTTLVSNLNADMLDSYHASDFSLDGHTHDHIVPYPNVSSSYDFDSLFISDKLKFQSTYAGSGDWTTSNVTNYPVTPTATSYMYGGTLSWYRNTQTMLQIYAPHTQGGNSDLFFRTGWNGNIKLWARVWTDRNDGSGSGLDADTLDTYHATDFSMDGHTHSQYLLNTTDTFTGTLTISGTIGPTPAYTYLTGGTINISYYNGSTTYDADIHHDYIKVGEATMSSTYSQINSDGTLDLYDSLADGALTLSPTSLTFTTLNDFQITNDNGLTLNSASNIYLKYNSSTKLSTTSTGIDITGLIESDTAKFTTGASNGYIAVSDALGNLTWTDPSAYTNPSITATEITYGNATSDGVTSDQYFTRSPFGVTVGSQSGAGFSVLGVTTPDGDGGTLSYSHASNLLELSTLVYDTQTTLQIRNNKLGGGELSKIVLDSSGAININSVDNGVILAVSDTIDLTGQADISSGITDVYTSTGTEIARTTKANFITDMGLVETSDISITDDYIAVGTGSGIEGTSSLTFSSGYLGIGAATDVYSAILIQTSSGAISVELDAATPTLLASSSLSSFEIGLNGKSDLTFNNGYMEFSDRIQFTDDSVIIGQGCGAADDGSNKNVFVGYNAGYSNVSGQGNVFIGDLAGEDFASGNYNVLIGDWAGKDLTSGANSIAIGENALRSATYTNNNIAIGTAALFSLTGTGQYNTAISYHALYYTQGYYNVALGPLALKYITTGDNNIAIGRNAGTNAISGTNNANENSIYIGAYTKSSLSTTTTNEIVIGYEAISNGPNTVTLGDDNITDVYLGESAGANLNANEGYLNYLDVAGNLDITANATIFTAAATTTNSSIRMPHGAAPTSPANGDVWTTTSGIFARVNGTTYNLTSTGTTTTINNNADNRIITGSATANTLEAEQYLTWDGGNLYLKGTTDGYLKIDSAANQDSLIIFDNNGTSHWQLGRRNDDDFILYDPYDEGTMIWHVDDSTYKTTIYNDLDLLDDFTAQSKFILGGSFIATDTAGTITGTHTATAAGHRGLVITPHIIAGTGTTGTQYGILNLPDIQSGSQNITSFFGNFFRADTKAAYTGTITNYAVVQISSPTISGGTASNVRGLYVTAVSGGTSSNRNIHSYNNSSTSGDHNLYINGAADNYIQGNLGLGTTAPSYQLQLSTNSAAKPTSSTWTVASDYRIKTNIRTFTDGLSIIKNLRPVWYNYNGADGTDDLHEDYISFIAQEVEPIAPYLVNTGKGNIWGNQVNDFKSLDLHAMNFLMVNAISELAYKDDDLESQITALKARVTELETEVEQLKSN